MYGVIDGLIRLKGDHVRVHDAAGGVFGVGQELPKYLLILGRDVVQDLFGFLHLEFTDEVRCFVCRQGFSDTRETFGFDLVHKFCADRSSGVSEDGASRLVIEGRDNVLTIVCRQQIEPLGDILRTHQTQEDLERLLFAFAKERVELAQERMVCGQIGHTASRRDLSVEVEVKGSEGGEGSGSSPERKCSWTKGDHTTGSTNHKLSSLNS